MPGSFVESPEAFVRRKFTCLNAGSMSVIPTNGVMTP
jgi:hypothetical protein